MVCNKHRNRSATAEIHSAKLSRLPDDAVFLEKRANEADELRRIRIGEAKKSGESAGFKVVTCDVGDLLVNSADKAQHDKLVEINESSIIWKNTENNFREVIRICKKYEVPVVKSPCPADGHTKREYIKQLLRQLNLENPGVKERMFTAIQTGIDQYKLE